MKKKDLGKPSRMEEIAKLQAIIRQKDEYIQHLEKVSEAYTAMEALAAEELKEANRVIHAQESLQAIAILEQKDALETIKAHEILEEMTRQEMRSAQEIIQAHEMVGTLADVEMMRKDLTLKNILEVNQVISSILDKEQLMHKIVESLMQTLAASRGILFLKTKDTLEPVILKRIKEEDLAKDTFAFSQEIIQEVRKTKKSRIVIRHKPDNSPEFLSLICVPLVYEKRLLGILYADLLSTDLSFKEQDLEISQIFSSQAAIALENSSLYQNLEEKVEERTQELNEALSIIKSDMRLAQNIQQKILPRNFAQFPGISFDTKYMPMSEIGGDIYDVASLPDGRIRIFLADATGHGVQAALVTMLIKAEYERLKNVADKPDELLELMNHDFYHEYKGLSVFFTSIVADIDIPNQKIYYASAGHPVQYLIRNKELVKMVSTGKMSGVVPEAQYHTYTEDFPPESSLILFTDGVFEEFSPNETEYGEARLEALLLIEIQRKKAKDIGGILDTIEKDVLKFIGKRERNDDITMVGVQLKS